MVSPHACSHHGSTCAIRMWGWRFRRCGTETIFLFLMLEKCGSMSYVHIKSFSSCQSQTYLLGSHLYICFLGKFLRGVPNAKDLDHLVLPTTWSCLLDLAVWRPEYSEMDSPVRCAPRKPTLSFLCLIYSFPDSYTSCLSSLTKEIHLDHEAKLFTASFFLYGQATTRTTKQLITSHPSPERWLHQCLGGAKLQHQCPYITYATSKTVYVWKHWFPSPFSPFGSLIPIRNIHVPRNDYFDLKACQDISN